MTGTATAAPAVLEQAAALRQTGRHGDAARLLYAELGELNPRDDTADEHRADLAVAFVHAARADGGRHDALGQWAKYAYLTYQRLHGLRHDATLGIGTLYAEVLFLRGYPREAAIVARQVTSGFTARHGPGDPRSVLATAALSTILLSIGRSGDARTVAVDAWRQWTSCPTTNAEITAVMLHACSIIAAASHNDAAPGPTTAQPHDDARPTGDPGDRGPARR